MKNKQSFSKNKLKLRIIRIFVVAVVVATTFYFVSPNFLKSTETQAIGDLTINWGVPSGNPIFIINNSAPGDIQTRNVTVTNGAPSPRAVGVRSIEKGGDTLKNILQIEISSAGADLYGGTTGTKTVADFFTDSSNPNGVFLFNLNPSQTKNIQFKVIFPQNAGNDFQNKSTIFDLVIGISIDLPPECNQINLLPSPIIGTSKAETLTGTPGNDLIIGLEGADRINGNGGDDCILGGPGADTINGGDGNDVIFGEDGADSISGGGGNDFISGGKGADTLRGGDGDDHLIGGQDADTLDGGNSNDILEGNEAADTLRGGDGNDTLDGGPGVDTANGGGGTDTCIAETKSNCEL